LVWKWIDRRVIDVAVPEYLGRVLAKLIRLLFCVKKNDTASKILFLASARAGATTSLFAFL
jgi:hypothetical protein